MTPAEFRHLAEWLDIAGTLGQFSARFAKDGHPHSAEASAYGAAHAAHKAFTLAGVSYGDSARSPETPSHGIRLPFL